MNSLTVPRLDRGNRDLNKVFSQMETLPFHTLNYTPWEYFPYKPTVNFRIAHDDTHIYLKYQVHEKNIVAKAVEHNGSVWKDSCVEFFLALENDGLFYNFEFNCIGKILLGVGSTGQDRVLADTTIINRIKVTSTLGTEPFAEKKGEFEWVLTAIIPLDSFFKHSIKNLSDKTCRANFYKCGDELTTPHFVAWNNIKTEKPNFHTPQFFGQIHFQ